MIRTELEKLFEAGFHALGVPFSRRVYGEEIVAGAGIDDQFEDVATADAQAMFDIDRAEALLMEIGLTDIQGLVATDNVPFFLRKSGEHNGFTVEYSVDPRKKLRCYEGAADRLVRKWKIVGESVTIQSAESPEIDVDIFLIHRPHKDISVQLVDKKVKAYFDATGRDGEKMLKMMKCLQGQTYDPEAVYRATMDYIRL